MRTLAYVTAIGLCLFTVLDTRAAPSIYAAVANGARPGVWRLEDRNDDKDALDAGETRLFGQRQGGGGFTDLAVDTAGVVYAIEGEGNQVYRIEDLNHDGDGLDVGELRVFRGEDDPGVRLAGPLGIAVGPRFDAASDTTRTAVYVMDSIGMRVVRLEDLDADSIANGPGESAIVQEGSEAAFTAKRIEVDKLGRILGCDANTLSVIRLSDRNLDTYIEPPPGTFKCDPFVPCGPPSFEEYHIIRRGAIGQFNLRQPFGITTTGKGTYFISQQDIDFRIVKLTDLNGDDDAQDAGEASAYYFGGSSDFTLRGFDLVSDDSGTLYLAEESLSHTGQIRRIEDLNGNGNAFDPGEATSYADFAAIGVPFGLATPLKPLSLMKIEVLTPDMSSEGDPILVVEDGVTATLPLRVITRDTAQRVADVSVVGQVVSGCFAVCPVYNRTDASGHAEFEVTRTVELGADEGEALILKVYGDQVLVPVVSTPCTPDPVADAGPDQVVQPSAAVMLDATASIGEGIAFCWQQTGGPDVGLPDCTEDHDGVVDFIAPAANARLTFTVHVRNACDEISEPDSVRVQVGDSICPLAATLGEEDPTSNLLRGIRDGVLADHAVGRKVIDGYSAHAGELTRLFASHPSLRVQALQLIRSWMPRLNRLLEGDRIGIDRRQIREISSFIETIGEVASPPLQDFLDQGEAWLMDADLLAELGIELEGGK